MAGALLLTAAPERSVIPFTNTSSVYLHSGAYVRDSGDVVHGMRLIADCEVNANASVRWQSAMGRSVCERVHVGEGRWSRRGDGKGAVHGDWVRAMRAEGGHGRHDRHTALCRHGKECGLVVEQQL
jgi:hypothetical protein